MCVDCSRVLKLSGLTCIRPCTHFMQRTRSPCLTAARLESGLGNLNSLVQLRCLQPRYFWRWEHKSVSAEQCMYRWCNFETKYLTRRRIDILAPLVKNITIEYWDKGANAFAIVVSDDSRLAMSSRVRRGCEHYSRPANDRGFDWCPQRLWGKAPFELSTPSRQSSRRWSTVVACEVSSAEFCYEC